jgi:hypothetical protein
MPLQTNRMMVKAASSELEEECNKLNWRITNKNKKQVTSIIKGVGGINSMEDVCMTCANMCGVQLAIVDVSKSKPLLYQFDWKIIKFIKIKKTKTWLHDNRDSIVHLPMVFMSKTTNFSSILPTSLRTPSTQTKSPFPALHHSNMQWQLLLRSIPTLTPTKRVAPPGQSCPVLRKENRHMSAVLSKCL